MRINTPKGTNISISPDIQSYLDKKLKTIKKLVDPADQAVLLDIELERTTRRHEKGNIYRAELNLSAKGGHLRAEAESSDLFSAIDKAKDEIIGALRSRKGKRISLIRRSGLLVKNAIKGIYEWPMKRWRGRRGIE